jgi:hypothetical protein
MALTRDQIASAVKTARPTATVSVPEWGGDVCMRALSGAEMSDIYRVLSDGFDPNRFMAMVAVCSTCDENGARLYKLAESEEQWREWSTEVCTILATKANEVNRLGVEARAEAKKDSDPIPS